MGFYDEVKVERAYPDVGIEAGDVLETKSLYAGFGKFTITADGKLVEHLVRYEQYPNDPHPRFLGKPVHIGDQTIEYHGDILLLGERRKEQCVARFTHGKLEWVEPISAYPEENRTLLVEQGAR